MESETILPDPVLEKDVYTQYAEKLIQLIPQVVGPHKWTGQNPFTIAMSDGVQNIVIQIRTLPGYFQVRRNDEWFRIEMHPPRCLDWGTGKQPKSFYELEKLLQDLQRAMMAKDI